MKDAAGGWCILTSHLWIILKLQYWRELIKAMRILNECQNCFLKFNIKLINFAYSCSLSSSLILRCALHASLWSWRNTWDYIIKDISKKKNKSLCVEKGLFYQMTTEQRWSMTTVSCSSICLSGSIIPSSSEQITISNTKQFLFAYGQLTLVPSSYFLDKV